MSRADGRQTVSVHRSRFMPRPRTFQSQDWERASWAPSAFLMRFMAKATPSSISAFRRGS